MNLGKISDVLINEGKLESFKVEKRTFFSLFFKHSGTTIEYKNIEKIGEDVILVKILGENN